MQIAPHELRLTRQFKAADPGHLDVGDQKVDRSLDQNAQRFVAIRRGQHCMTGLREDGDNHLLQPGLIVNQEDRIQLRRPPRSNLKLNGPPQANPACGYAKRR
jgi:hypothetical protein